MLLVFLFFFFFLKCVFCVTFHKFPRSHVALSYALLTSSLRSTFFVVSHFVPSHTLNQRKVKVFCFSVQKLLPCYIFTAFPFGWCIVAACLHFFVLLLFKKTLKKTNFSFFHISLLIAQVCMLCGGWILTLLEYWNYW